MRCLQINKIMHVELYCLLPYSVVQSKVKTKKYFAYCMYTVIIVIAELSCYW